MVEQADHHRRLRWPGPKSAIPLGAAIVAVAAALVILLSGVLRPAPQSRAGVLGGSPAASSAPLVVPAPSSPTPVESPSSAPAATVPPDVQLASAPPQRTGEAVAFDGANAAVVLFGGVSGSTTLADTWLFSGGAWTQAHPRTSPPPRTGAAMAYNPATGHVVLVGGTSGSGARLDDTWIWDGTTWSAVAVRTRPTGIPIALAFDSDRGTLVLLTRASGTAAAARTWTFAAGTWSERPSAAATAASQGAAMVDDPSLGRLVLVDVAGTATRTWDGRAWSDVPGAATPSGASANIAFDPAGRELVLVVSAPGQPPSTWVFDGTAWRARATELGPATVAALTSTTTQVLAFGGPTAADDLSQAWRWSSASWGG